MERINEEAFLMEEEALVMTEEGVAEIVNDILEEWLLVGGAEQLALPTVERGIFSGFLSFLKTAVFVVRIYSRWKFVSRTFNTRRRKKMLNTNVKRR